MTDTRKEFERFMIANSIAADDENNGLVIWQSCQSLNDKRIEQLLAVIAKKDEALIKACELIEKFSLQVYNGSDCLKVYDAVELQPSDVELVEVGYIDDFGNFENSLKPWMKDEPNIEWIPTYTIKTKANTK